MNWQIPDLREECNEFNIQLGFDSIHDHFHDTFRNRERDILNTHFSNEIEWLNPWPTLPSMDITFPWSTCDEIDVIRLQPPCEDLNVLGYYIPYHALLKTFFRHKGQPLNHIEVLRFNRDLPEHSRYGIHICEDAITNYVDETLRAKNIGIHYRELALALLIQAVIGHEWGHYRAEVNSLQINRFLKSTGSRESCNYNAYQIYMRRIKKDNFEEVFADYCSLKMGVFNPKFELDNLYGSSNVHKEMVKLRIAQCIFENDNSPYGDLKYWMKNQSEFDSIIETLINNPSQVRRRVAFALKLNKAKSPFQSDLIDVLTHNQMQFITKRDKSILIRSRESRVDFDEVDTFWQFISRDPLVSNRTSKNNLRIPLRAHSLSSTLSKILPTDFKNDSWRVPLITIPDLLPLNEILIH